MTTNGEPMKFYRYEEVSYASMDHDGEYYSPIIPDVRVVLKTYNLHKETPKGYWIGHVYYAPEYLRGNSRWVSKTGRKRFAYPTKEEAMTNFIKRTERRVKILKAQLLRAEIRLRNAKGMVANEMVK